MALLLFAFIVVAHPTTVIFILGAVVLKEVVGRSWRYLSKNKRPEALDKPWPIGYFLLIWLGWYFTGAISYSGSLISFFEARLGDFFSIGTSVSSQVQLRSSGNIFGAFASDVRTLTLVVFILLAILAIIIYLVYRKKRPAPFPKNLLALLAISFLMIPLDTLFFNGQLYDRGLLFIMIVVPLFFVPLLILRANHLLRPILLVSVTILVVLCASTMYYQQSLYTVSEEAISASTFVNDHSSTYVVAGYIPSDVWNNQIAQYELLFVQFSIPAKYVEVIDDIRYGGFIFDNTSANWYTHYGISNMYNMYLSETSNEYKVYDNGIYSIYMIRGSKERMRIGLVNLMTKTADVSSNISSVMSAPRPPESDKKSILSSLRTSGRKGP